MSDTPNRHVNLDQPNRVVQLEALVERLASFIEDQLDRLELYLQGESSDAGDSLIVDEVVRQGVDELAQDRQRWELERQVQIEDLREESQRLTEAWARLEQEERNLLARESIAQLDASTGGARFVPGTRPSQPSAEPTTNSNQVEQQVNSRSSVVKDFQQLSREMAKHSRDR